MDPSKHFALVVGIDNYPAFRPLNGAEGDATDVTSWLVNDMGVPGANIRKLVSSDFKFKSVYDARPIAQQVHDWLNELEAMAEGKPEDFPLGERVYVFFAGHGYNASTAQQTAIMACTRPSYWDVIPLLPLRTHLQTTAYFSEVIVVSDACRDQIDYASDPHWPRKAATHPNAAKVNVFEVYAAKAGQKAKEMDFGGKIRGVLTQAFLEGVRGVAADPSGDVWADKLEGHIRSAVVEKLGREASPTGECPRPPLSMLICKAAQKKPILVLDPKHETAGQAILQRKLDNSETTIDLAVGRQEFTIPAGFYSLRTPSGKEHAFGAAWEVTRVEI